MIETAEVSQPVFVSLEQSLRFRIWQLRRLASEQFLDARLRFVRSQLPSEAPPRLLDRVCIVTALAHRNGITRGAQLQYECFRRLEIDAELLDASRAQRNPLFRIQHKPATLYIFHCGGAETAALLSSVLPSAKTAYRVAYWAWEMPLPPHSWPSDIISEIWTCSQYSKDSLKKRYSVPIHVVPHAIGPLGVSPSAKKDNRFTVLSLADSRSSFDRKNPMGSIEAFRLAFGDRTDARLILKINGDSSEVRTKLETLRLNNVEIIDDFLSDEELSQLFQSSDVLLSLHRAEGFGLPMLEAMALGTPVIGTAWSGNLDFMNDANSLLISCVQTPVTDARTYSSFQDITWAEPNVKEAATALLNLQLNPDLAARLAVAGRKTAEDIAKKWRPPDWTTPAA